MAMTDHLSPPLPATEARAGTRLQAEQRQPEHARRPAKLTAVLFCAEHPGKNQRLGTALLPSVEFLQQRGYL